MKHNLFFSTFMLTMILAMGAWAQDNKMPSPPAMAEGSIDGVKVKIEYHQPSARGRKMLGDHEPYGTVWRTGANETTSIEFMLFSQFRGKVSGRSLLTKQSSGVPSITRNRRTLFALK